MIPARLRGLLAGCGVLFLAACGETPERTAAPTAGLDQAALLTASCSGCHAAGGSSIASLAGMSAGDIEGTLLAYRNNPEGGSAMHRMARGYTPEQIAVIAQTLGGQTP